MSFSKREDLGKGKISTGLKVQQPFKSPLRVSDANREELKNKVRSFSSPVIQSRETPKQKAAFSPNQPIAQESQENKESRIAKDVDEKASHNTTPRKPVAMNTCRGRLLSRKRASPRQFSAPFRSPASSSGQEVLTQEEDLNKLLKLECELDEEISSLKDLGYKVEELQTHISNLHQYNEIKDAAQVVMGRLAELDGVTVKEIHEKYGASCLA